MIRQVLIEAAAIIRRKGLAKGCLTASDGSVCVIQALVEAGIDDASDAFRVLAKHVGLEERYWELPEWNNQSTMTADKVVAALEACADGQQ